MQPLARATPLPATDELLTAYMREMNLTRRQAIRFAQSEAAKLELWINDTYQVSVHRTTPAGFVHWLNIRRRDGEAVLRDWRDFQAIKNQLAGPEVEACELYPAESRCVDTSNKYHLWCLPPGVAFPFGFVGRDVREPDTNAEAGLKQR